MDEEAKKKILARRASFVAAALAGVSCGKEPAPTPMPCLSQVFIPPDAGDDATPSESTATKTPAPPDAGEPPKPRDPFPMACLSPMPNWDAGVIGPAKKKP